MLRSILFFGLIGLCVALSIIAVNETEAYDTVGDLLQAIFGPLRDEESIAGIGTTALFSAWLLLAVTWILPTWRRRVRSTMIGWPFGQAKGASFLLRTFLLICAVSVALVLYNDFDDEISIILVLGGYSAFLGMLIYDFRGMLLTGDLSDLDTATSNIATDSSGWILPDTITADMLGKPELRFELAKDLRRRASNMCRFSFIALAGIGALLVVAVNVILFAGFIANLGVGVTGPERIQQMLDSEYIALTNAQRNLHALVDRQKKEELEFYRRGNTTRANIKSLESKFITNEDRLNYRNSDDYNEFLIKKLNIERLEKAHTQSIEAIFEERTAYLKNSIQSDFGTAEDADNLNLLIASGITRFGILFIMLFIVQILVNLYRYTMRMSAYYLSQADALLLAEDGGDSLLKVVPVLSPQDVDFGKAPQTPIQSLEKLAAAAAKLR